MGLRHPGGDDTGRSAGSPQDLRLDLPVGLHVTASVHRPAPPPSGPPLLLTHGAGGDKDDAGLVALAAALADHGRLVVRSNLPYREAGPKRPPPRAERSAVALAGLAERLGDVHAGNWVLGGKSYGGRVASLAVADGARAAGLLFVGYPLHPPGRPDRLRVDHWPSIGVPCCFLQGERDPFCDLDLLHANLDLLPRTPLVEIVAGGDHSLRVGRAAAPDGVARPPAAVLTALAPKVAAWMARLTDSRPGPRSTGAGA